jgi:hypothetical protein
MACPSADPTLLDMIRMQLSQDINRLVETVFDYFSDCRNETQWNPFVKAIDKIGVGPIGLNARFRGDYPGVGSAELQSASTSSRTASVFRVPFRR